ncbi:uncharacterized protein LOC126481615 isoform X1 [Schistocerca serialis cubense]|uniref:uncharacterized protein LOC126481615 isoform X1 n=1 Tax=Schistocerca serialis cubense TaxID=2023355 RepID=UPI00214E5677|nr:uncharacterized protein LOC126481615 isoform X1 [Schistocerca serialis cubense]
MTEAWKLPFAAAMKLILLVVFENACSRQGAACCEPRSATAPSARRNCLLLSATGTAAQWWDECEKPVCASCDGLSVTFMSQCELETYNCQNGNWCTQVSDTACTASRKR